MRSCSVLENLQITAGSVADYDKLRRYHYRDEHLGPFAAIFVIRPTGVFRPRAGTGVIGVIVYSMPSPAVELRNIATAKAFCGFDRQTQLALVNRNIRRISRVIVEPRFRSLGLAARLVRETMSRMNVAIIEAMGVMGAVNPFFEKAGMTAYTAPMPSRCVRLIEALSTVGIEEAQLIDPQKIQQKLDDLAPEKADFIEAEIRSFLQSYGRRREMSPGPQRTRYVLSKLTFRPTYYIWFNPKLTISV